MSTHSVQPSTHSDASTVTGTSALISTRAWQTPVLLRQGGARPGASSRPTGPATPRPAPLVAMDDTEHKSADGRAYQRLVRGTQGAAVRGPAAWRRAQPGTVRGREPAQDRRHLARGCRNCAPHRGHHPVIPYVQQDVPLRIRKSRHAPGELRSRRERARHHVGPHGPEDEPPAKVGDRVRNLLPAQSLHAHSLTGQFCQRPPPWHDERTPNVRVCPGQTERPRESVAPGRSATAFT
jgi:hypothetical protein